MTQPPLTLTQKATTNYERVQGLCSAFEEDDRDKITAIMQDCEFASSILAIVSSSPAHKSSPMYYALDWLMRGFDSNSPETAEKADVVFDFARLAKKRPSIAEKINEELQDTIANWGADNATAPKQMQMFVVKLLHGIESFVDGVIKERDGKVPEVYTKPTSADVISIATRQKISPS
jgi:hypothetical protein